MVLGDVEETVTQVEIDEETYEEMTRVYPINCTSYLPIHCLIFCVIDNKASDRYAVCPWRRSDRRIAPSANWLASTSHIERDGHAG